MACTQKRVQMYLPRGEVFISKDTAGLPNGFIQRSEFLKANTYSPYPLMAPGSSTSTHSHRWCRMGSCTHRAGHALSVMKSGSDHTATCLPVHIRQGVTSSWVACRGHANFTATARISPRSSCSQKHMCLMSPRGRLAQSCQSTVQRTVKDKPDSWFLSTAFAFPLAKQLIIACKGLAHTLNRNSPLRPLTEH